MTKREREKRLREVLAWKPLIWKQELGCWQPDGQEDILVVVDHPFEVPALTQPGWLFLGYGRYPNGESWAGGYAVSVYHREEIACGGEDTP